MEQVMTIREIIATINHSQKEVVVHVELGEVDGADGEESGNKG